MALIPKLTYTPVLLPTTTKFLRDDGTFETPAGGGGGGTPGGTPGQLQFNNAGTFDGVDEGDSGDLCVSSGAGFPAVFTSVKTATDGLLNLTADKHPLTPNAADDEFETGSILDTAGTRFVGATPWSTENLQGSTTTLQDGSLVFTYPGGGSQDIAIVRQPAPVGTWVYRMKIAAYTWPTQSVTKMGILAKNSADGRLMLFNMGTDGFSFLQGRFYIDPHTNTSTSISISLNPFVDNTSGNRTLAIPVPLYVQLESDGTTLTWSMSFSGADGTFFVIGSETIATNIGAVDQIGVGICNDNSNSVVFSLDWWRRVA